MQKFVCSDGQKADVLTTYTLIDRSLESVLKTLVRDFQQIKTRLSLQLGLSLYWNGIIFDCCGGSAS